MSTYVHPFDIADALTSAANPVNCCVGFVPAISHFFSAEPHRDSLGSLARCAVCV